MTTVLLIEDSDVFRRVLRAAIEERFSFLSVEEARNNAEAVEKANHITPALIVMDLSLPDGCGLSLARRLYELLPETKIIIATNNDEPEYREASQACGAVDFVVKGRISRQEFLDSVGKALGVG